MVVCATRAVRGLDRGAHSLMTVTNQMASSLSMMSGPAVGQERLVIVGASGMVGSYALRYALDTSAVKSVRTPRSRF